MAVSLSVSASVCHCMRDIQREDQITSGLQEKDERGGMTLVNVMERWRPEAQGLSPDSNMRPRAECDELSPACSAGQAAATLQS